MCPSENVNAHGRRQRTLFARHGSPGDTRYEKRVATQQDRSSTRGTPSSSLAKVGNPLGGVSYCLASLALSTLFCPTFFFHFAPSDPSSLRLFPWPASFPLLSHVTLDLLVSTYYSCRALFLGQGLLCAAGIGGKFEDDWWLVPRTRAERGRRGGGAYAPRHSWRALVNCN